MVIWFGDVITFYRSGHVLVTPETSSSELLLFDLLCDETLFLLSYLSLQHNKYFYCSVFDDEQRCVEQELSCGVFVLLFFFLWVFFMFTYKILNSKLHHTKSHQTKETNFKTKQNIQTQRKEIKKTHTSWWVQIKSKDKP